MKIGYILLALLLVLIGLFLGGPRSRVDTRVRALHLPADLDQYLAQAEARFPDIRPGTAKSILWAHADKRPTPLSIVYLHGYSATRQETSPLCEQLAAQLGANLFYTRLTGHGRPGAAMAELTANDWLNDAHEALEIGRRLGERVIVVGSSTGATLATWLAQQPEATAARAFVLMSPNFGPRDPLSELLTLPWMNTLAPLINGELYSWQPSNPRMQDYWTYQYPTRALLPMMALVEHVRASALESIRQPVLVVYSPLDQVVDAGKIEAAFVRIGSASKRLHAVARSANPQQHVLAGDIMAPGDTQAIRSVILDFVGSLQ